jgi:hypothetical protein
MNEHGQIFTLDMFFALALTALIVSYSGLAFEQARRQAEGYAFRYSLERTTNDAADVLMKTLGFPENWNKQVENLRTLGFTEENAGAPILNTVSVMKFGQFRHLTNEDNWSAATNASAVEAIKKLFGGSEKFQVRILDENDNELWHAFPMWSTGDVGENSGAENSLDVTVVRRLVAVRYGSAIRADTGPLYKGEGGAWDNENLEFEVYPGELEAFDFYIIVVEVAPVGGNPNLKIYLNRDTSGDPDYTFVNETMDVYPNPDEPPVGHFVHGGVENDINIDEDDQLVEGFNYLSFKRTSNAGWTIRVYIIVLPSCSDWDEAPMFLQSLPATLEVKMWR